METKRNPKCFWPYIAACRNLSREVRRMKKGCNGARRGMQKPRGSERASVAYGQYDGGKS